MLTELSKTDLNKLYALLPHGADAEIDAIRSKIRLMIVERSQKHTWSTLAFTISFELKNAPTLNVYNGMKPWMKANLRKKVDKRLSEEMLAWPMAKLGASLRKRGVRVTRHSSSPVDETTVDVLGGKIAVDRLVHANILAGDSARWLEREALWKHAAPGSGRVTVEVFELT